MREEVIVVFCTVPDVETGRAIAHGVIGEKLAACVNILPGIESIYRWKDAIETASENLLIIKSTTWKYQMLEAKILELHPYETPEIISVRADAGSVKYLRWIDESVS
jgi:periplasmic divalent cation tolerance protein